METTYGGELHNFYGPVVSDLKDVGKKGTEWDLNEWRWDGDLFMATPLNSVPSDCKSRQLFPVGSNIPANSGAASNGPDEVMVGAQRENRDLEKRRRVFEIENELGGGSLNLKLGGQVYPITEGEMLQGASGKKTKFAAGLYSRAVCQVEDCRADLSDAKDYHRRHKVCDVHSKATSALVANVLQRFCQQCSRFHVLKEFDEGKRSCRRRLAGHNKRRRKTHPDNAATQNDERGSNYLLISLLRILSNIHSNSSGQLKDQDLLSHLLSNLASATNERNGAGLFAISQGLQNPGTSLKDLTTPAGPVVTVPTSDLTQKGVMTDEALCGVPRNACISQSASPFPTNSSNPIKDHKSDATVGRTKLNNIDLNHVYDGSQDCPEEPPSTSAPENLGNISSAGPLWLYKDPRRSSPPRISGNSGSTSSQSPSTSSGEAQSRTDRIVFKLFGKDPSDFPLALRKQILDWLSNSPTDIESYIRPGCIILTIYLRMDRSRWDELYCDLACSLKRFLNSSADAFWRTGWIYARLQHHVTFMYNGQVVLDTPLPVKHHINCRISSIKPIAATVSENVRFSVQGFNLSRSTLRLLCTLEGNYLVQENCADMTRGADSFVEHDTIQSFSFSCVIPNIVGRGFIEVEDHGLSSSFFPFIVAEKDVCAEICTLESIFEDTDPSKGDDTNELEIRNEALEFIHEMGWLLHRTRLKYTLGETCGDLELFSFQRFRRLTEFSIDHDWCAVLRKLLNILFGGYVDFFGQEKSNFARLLDAGLLHRAVRRNSSTMVEFLLNYRPSGARENTGPLQKLLDGDHYLFRPDATGPGGLTPLHIAACLGSCDDVVDALTEDPGSVGIVAWKSARDSNGSTPHDYARLRGHYSYNNLVWRKLNKNSLGKAEAVVVDIPVAVGSVFTAPKTGNASKCGAALECERECGQCRARRLSYGNCCSALRSPSSVRLYRPAMLSMVAIAAVCVCTALLFKSSPYVHYLVGPFRWELLKYGSQ